MKINILQPINLSNPKSMFKIILMFEFGDAESNQDIEQFFDKKDENFLILYINAFKAIYQEHDFNLILDKLEKYCNQNNLSKEYFQSVVHDIPDDPFSDNELKGCFVGYDLTYFDENGIEYRCEVLN